MEKLTIKQIKENLKGIEVALNDHEQWEIENGCVDYALKLNKDSIQFMISCEDEIFENYDIELVEFDMKSILKSIINYLYENEINYRQNYIDKTKSFNNRKIKSMSLWLSRNKQDKVEQINKELVERYNTTEKMKYEVVEYKDYIRDLYRTLTELCPCWKMLDIREYLLRKLEENSINNTRVDFVDNILIVTKFNGDEVIERIEMEIDTYTNKNKIVNEIMMKLR